MTNPFGPLGPLEPLESLQSKSDTRAESRTASDGWAAHEAVLDRLAANVRVAQAHGWTSCAIERVDDAARFTAWGVPPGECQRHVVPDWSHEPDGKESGQNEQGTDSS
jgi:hypothetical protein